MSVMLEIDLRSLAEGPTHRSGRMRPDAPPWTETRLRFVEPLEVSFTAWATRSGGVRVEGSLEALVRLTCRRCLTEGEQRFEVPYRFFVEPGLEPDAADEGLYPMQREGDFLDLGPNVREELLVVVPKYSLCREDCRGLCPHCGADLNSDTCDCKMSELDPRWEVLRKLRA
jgi:DUF177 domain-containing protein